MYKSYIYKSCIRTCTHMPMGRRNKCQPVSYSLTECIGQFKRVDETKTGNKIKHKNILKEKIYQEISKSGTALLLVDVEVTTVKCNMRKKKSI